MSKAELMATLWPGVAETSDVLVQCIKDIRPTLGDDAREPVRQDDSAAERQASGLLSLEDTEVRRAPLGEGCLNAPPVQGVTMGLGIVRAIALHEVGLRARPADAATDGVGFGQAEVLAQEIAEEQAGFDPRFVGDSVDRHPDADEVRNRVIRVEAPRGVKRTGPGIIGR